MARLGRNKVIAIVAAAAVVVGGGVVAVTNPEVQEALGLRDEPGANLPHHPREMLEAMMGESQEAGEEAFEAATADGQFSDARTAPGIVSPGAYGAAYAALKGLPATAGQWSEVTKLPYDSDDPRYRDYSSNSSGGSGKVTGRITGLAADGS